MINQAIWTHSKKRSGWGVLSSTFDLDLDLEELIRERGSYRFPPAPFGSTAPTQVDETSLPCSLRLVTDGRWASLSLVTPVGKELSGTGVRGGNVLAHLCFASSPEALRAGKAARPIQFLDSRSLLTAEPEQTDVEPLEVLEPGSSISEASASAFLAATGRSELAGALVAAVLRAHWRPDKTCTAVCIIGTDIDEVTGWLSVVSFWLPIGLTWQISLDTFASRPAGTVSPAGRTEHPLRPVLSGAVTDMLERGGIDEATCTFDPSTAEMPNHGSGPLASVLTAMSFAEVRPLISTMDALADCSAVPTDEAGWMTLYYAASLMLGEGLTGDGQRAVTEWLARHAITLGPSRVEVLASTLDRDLLTPDELLSLVAAGSAASAAGVVLAFEAEAFDRAFEQACDRLSPPPDVAPIDWSDGLLVTATRRIVESLETSPGDQSWRLVTLAGAMNLTLPDEILVDAGRWMVGILATEGDRATALPSSYLPSLGQGLLDQLDVEPISEHSLFRLQDALGATGLLESLVDMDPARHPVAAVQLRIPGMVGDEPRLAMLADLPHGLESLDPLVLHAILALMWPDGRATVSVLDRLVTLLQSAPGNRWVVDALDRLAVECSSLDELLDLHDVIERSGLRGEMDWASASRLRPIATLKSLSSPRLRFHGSVLEAMRQATRFDPELAYELAKGFGIFGYRLDLTDVLGLFEIAVQYERVPGSKQLTQALAEGVVQGVIESETDRDPNDTLASERIVANLAPGLLLARQHKPLEEVCRHLVEKWDPTAIARVFYIMRQAHQRKLAAEWEVWASANLKRRFLRS